MVGGTPAERSDALATLFVAATDRVPSDRLHGYVYAAGEIATIAFAVIGDPERLRRLPFVRYVELDPIDAVHIAADTLEYGVDNIDAEVVWGGSQGATTVIPGQGGAGAKVAVESRGLLLPPDRFVSENFPQLIEWDLDWFRANGYHYLVASSQSFGRPLSGSAPDNQTRAYRALFDRLELLTTIVPSDEHPGEQWRVYRLPPG